MDTARACSDEDTILPLGEIDSVKNNQLDQEHEECSAALCMLSEQRSASALALFIDVFQRHCAHEEALLEQHLYAQEQSRLVAEGGVSLLLDSRTSHFQDHQRIIGAAKQELAGLDSAGVSVNFVNTLLRDFENHANRYDASYADRLAAVIGA